MLILNILQSFECHSDEIMQFENVQNRILALNTMNSLKSNAFNIQYQLTITTYQSTFES